MGFSSVLNCVGESLDDIKAAVNQGVKENNPNIAQGKTNPVST